MPERRLQGRIRPELLARASFFGVVLATFEGAPVHFCGGECLKRFNWRQRSQQLEQAVADDAKPAEPSPIAFRDVPTPGVERREVRVACLRCGDGGILKQDRHNGGDWTPTIESIAKLKALVPAGGGWLCLSCIKPAERDAAAEAAKKTPVAVIEVGDKTIRDRLAQGRAARPSGILADVTPAAPPMVGRAAPAPVSASAPAAPPIPPPVTKAAVAAARRAAKAPGG